MDDGPEAIVDPLEKERVRRQGWRVTILSTVSAAVVTAVLLLVPAL